MKIKIKGYVEIIGKNNGFYKRIENYIDIYKLATILFNVFNNNVPSGNATPFITISGAFAFKSYSQTVFVTYNNFEWSGTFSISINIVINMLQLFATFNGALYPISTVKTQLLLPAGEYTINWIWVVDDPAGLVKDILNFLFQGTYKGFSVIKGTCTNYQKDSALYDTVTLYFVCLATTKTTIYDVSFTFAIEYGKTTTHTTTVTVNTTLANTVTFITGNVILIPLVITLI